MVQYGPTPQHGRTSANEVSDVDRIRILSLDGGGSFAGVLAIALGRLYGDDTPGRRIIRQFDLVAANSGGSIVLAALCCNYTPRDVAGFYADADTVRRMYSPRWSEVFTGSKWLLPLRVLFPPYSTLGKRNALGDMLDRNQQAGEPPPSSVLLSEWPRLIGGDVQLLITAYDYESERGAFFRSNEASLARSAAPHGSPTLLDAVHASTHGPILYYPEPAEVSGRRYWDGGIAGYNNPVLAAVVEAAANFRGRVRDMCVLSIGTGAVARASTAEGAEPPLGEPAPGNGLFTALRKVGTAVLADPPGAASFHAYAALGHAVDGAGSGPGAAPRRLVRICPFVHPSWTKGAWTLPEGFSADEFARLADMPADTMVPADLALIEKTAHLWIAGKVANQPIRMGARMQCDIGDDSFGEAAARWWRIAGDAAAPGPRYVSRTRYRSAERPGMKK